MGERGGEEGATVDGLDWLWGTLKSSAIIMTNTSRTTNKRTLQAQSLIGDHLGLERLPTPRTPQQRGLKLTEGPII